MIFCVLFFFGNRFFKPRFIFAAFLSWIKFFFYVFFDKKIGILEKCLTNFFLHFSLQEKFTWNSFMIFISFFWRVILGIRNLILIVVFFPFIQQVNFNIQFSTYNWLLSIDHYIIPNNYLFFFFFYGTLSKWLSFDLFELHHRGDPFSVSSLHYILLSHFFLFIRWL